MDESERLEMTESELTKQILDYLAAKGAFCWKNWSGGRASRARCKKGIPDILGLYKGIFIGIEVKVGKNKLSPDQEKFLNAITDSGGFGMEARSLDDMVTAFERRFMDWEVIDYAID